MRKAVSAKAALGALLCLALVSCSAPGTAGKPLSPAIEVVGIVIHNALTYPVHDVKVEVPATGRFTTCGNVFPRTECKTSFPALDYRENGMVVSWLEHGEPQSTDEFVLERPGGAQAGDRFWLEVIVYGPGLAGARLVQP